MWRSALRFARARQRFFEQAVEGPSGIGLAALLEFFNPRRDGRLDRAGRRICRLRLGGVLRAFKTRSFLTPLNDSDQRFHRHDDFALLKIYSGFYLYNAETRVNMNHRAENIFSTQKPQVSHWTRRGIISAPM